LLTDAPAVLELYNKALYKKNELVTFSHNSMLLQLKVHEMLPSGQLRVGSHDKNFAITHGEYQWLYN
jgi:hypothetical protein